MRAGLLLEAREEAEDAEVLLVERALDREERAVLGEEEEHQPQHHGQQAAVDVAARALERVAEERAEAVGVALGRGLEAREQHLERVEDLAGELLGDVRLAPAALLEERGEGDALVDAEEALDVEERDERVEDRPAAHLRHVAQPERDVPGALAVGRVDEPQLVAVGEQADRDAHVAEQPVELRGRRVAPLAARRLGGVEREPEPRRARAAELGRRREVPDEHRVGRARLRRPGGVGALRHLEVELLVQRERRPQHLVRLGDVEREGGRQRLAAVVQILGEAEHLLEEPVQILDPRPGLGALLDRARRAPRLEPTLELRRPLVGPADAQVRQHGRGEHEPLRRLDHAQPGLVEAAEGVTHRAPPPRRSGRPPRGARGPAGP